MEPIKSAINELMRSLTANNEQAAGRDPEALLKKLLTKRELKHIKFKYFRKRIFGIIVDSSAWIYQLNLKKESLLSGLRNDIKEIKDIRFHLGEVE